jgi:hypothetical protein
MRKFCAGSRHSRHKRLFDAKSGLKDVKMLVFGVQHERPTEVSRCVYADLLRRARLDPLAGALRI